MKLQSSSNRPICVAFNGSVVRRAWMVSPGLFPVKVWRSLASSFFSILFFTDSEFFYCCVWLFLKPVDYVATSICLRYLLFLLSIHGTLTLWSSSSSSMLYLYFVQLMLVFVFQCGLFYPIYFTSRVSACTQMCAKQSSSLLWFKGPKGKYENIVAEWVWVCVFIV